MEHVFYGKPVRLITSDCLCGDGEIFALVTDEEVAIGMSHGYNYDGDEIYEDIVLSPGGAMKFAMDILGPALYGMQN